MLNVVLQDALGHPQSQGRPLSHLVSGFESPIHQLVGVDEAIEEADAVGFFAVNGAARVN